MDKFSKKKKKDVLVSFRFLEQIVPIFCGIKGLKLFVTKGLRKSEQCAVKISPSLKLSALHYFRAKFISILNSCMFHL